MAKLDIFSIKSKIVNRVWMLLVKKLRAKRVYPTLYRSYWHQKFLFSRRPGDFPPNYLTAVPNKGAGIGHQLANWIAGYWFARKFSLKFAHVPFSTSKWDRFLSLGRDEIEASQLIQVHGYKPVKLPLFDEHNIDELFLIKKIIRSYGAKKVVFFLEQDQYYSDQYGVINDLQQKFHFSDQRKHETLVFDRSHYNIAIHVRRGDISIGQLNQDPNLVMRWQNNDYFYNVLRNVLSNLRVEKPVNIYLFSQGDRNEFKEFEEFEGINFCLDMDAQNSFLHMIFADILITSKSSFSYKPALFNRGLKVVPANFWHGYPNDSRWIIADENGYFDPSSIASVNT